MEEDEIKIVVNGQIVLNTWKRVVDTDVDTVIRENV